MKKKILALCLVVALLATAIVGATLAYFTDTDEALNTFTVGNVNIDLTEPDWNPQKNHLQPGVEIPKDPTITVETGSDDCWLFMEVEMNKFNSWLRLVGIQNDLMTYECTGAQACKEHGHCQGHFDEAKFDAFFASGAFRAAFDEWFSEIKHEEWEIMNLNDVLASIKKSWTDSSIKTINPIFGYKTTQSAGDSVTLFTAVHMPENVTSEELAHSRFNTTETQWKLNLKAYAIQAAELNTLAEAYEALFD